MTSDSTVVCFRQPETVDDPLTAVLRSGARRLLTQAIKAEADAFLAEMKGARLADGRERLVRHGRGPERQVQTGIGPVEVQRVKLRDRGVGEGTGSECIRFTSTILPRWARRTRNLDALLPILCRRGLRVAAMRAEWRGNKARTSITLAPTAAETLAKTLERRTICAIYLDFGHITGP